MARFGARGLAQDLLAGRESCFRHGHQRPGICRCAANQSNGPRTPASFHLPLYLSANAEPRTVATRTLFRLTFLETETVPPAGYRCESFARGTGEGAVVATAILSDNVKPVDGCTRGARRGWGPGKPLLPLRGLVGCTFISLGSPAPGGPTSPLSLGVPAGLEDLLRPSRPVVLAGRRASLLRSCGPAVLNPLIAFCALRPRILHLRGPCGPVVLNP